ncbi:MAG: protein kinase [Gemmataceae bacterium]
MDSPATRRIEAGGEPIPGYRLLEPLGQGGFGVVWKCHAPGGMVKAIKFVPIDRGDTSPGWHERAALDRMKLLRHPFLLSLERVEEVDDHLVIITELADLSLHTLLADYRSRGQPGVPRDELLGYLVEAAEALDWMNFQHGLQHSDVKPHNLFLVSGHVKVADFGLVRQLRGGDGRPAAAAHACFTPLYSPPELLSGAASRQSDQYSLAIVYQQLLTGTLPFWSSEVHELVKLHLHGWPNLTPLSEADRPVVARALSRDPDERFPSCLDFVQALHRGDVFIRRSGQWQRPPLPAKPGQGLATPPTPASPADATRITVPLTAGPEPLAAGTPLPPTVLAGANTTVVVLPGFRLVTCLNQSAHADLWHAEDASGRPFRANCLPAHARQLESLTDYLQLLRDPVLPPSQTHVSAEDRMVILTPWYDGTLRDRYERCRAEDRPGIPRPDLIRLLRTAAATLDDLFGRHGTAHLCVNPRNMLVDGDRLWLADAGLVPHVWTLLGLGPTSVNARYAAPELYDRPGGGAADQFALALIYTEMLTGFLPRVPRAAPIGRGSSSRGSSHSRAQPRIDLDLLPVHDRETVRRALDADPDGRFPSCVAFLDALEAATAPAEAADRPFELPPILELDELKGQPPSGAPLPPVVGLLRGLIASLRGPQQRKMVSTSYFVHPDGSWEHRCPLQLFPGALQIRVDGFRAHWKAQVIYQSDTRFRLEIDVPGPRGLLARYLKAPPRIEVDIQIHAGRGVSGVTEATVRVRPPADDPARAVAMMTQMAPEILESVRSYLQVANEHRGHDRCPLRAPILVYPVIPPSDLGDRIEGTTRNVSEGGVSLELPTSLPQECFFVHFPTLPPLAPFALLARAVRTRPIDTGVEVGAVSPPRPK